MTDDANTLAPLRVVGLRKTFGDITAVSDVSFDIAAGGGWRCWAESGCGKTTLLRMIAGLERPTRAASWLRAGTSPICRPTSGL